MDKPVLIVVAGPNGSGKTSITATILHHQWIEGCRYINPDNIAQEMFGSWNSSEAILKAADYAAQEREMCVAQRQNLIFETVLSAADKVEFVRDAKRKDYFIRLFFIGTDSPQINVARIAHRVVLGGHDVPINKIISRYYKSITNCAALASVADRLYVYDNSTENAEPLLLFRTTDGQLTKEYAPHRIWADVILQAVKTSRPTNH